MLKCQSVLGYCYLAILATTVLACGVKPKAGDERGQHQWPTATTFYERFSFGDETTDQNAGAPGSHSSLVGTNEEGADVIDRDLALNVASPALARGTTFFWSLGQCFSGGFIDDLIALGGKQSVLASARHSETANYGYEAPEGVDVDYTDAFIQALGDGTARAESVAAETARIDPFGTNPDAPRISEPIGSEHIQYAATGGGENLRLIDSAKNGMAVLWAGQPARRDGEQMNVMLHQLVAMGFSPSKIVLLYGTGASEWEHELISGVTLTAARRDHLVSLFERTYGPGSRSDAPEFVFFYVGDHGGLDGKQAAKNNH